MLGAENPIAQGDNALPPGFLVAEARQAAEAEHGMRLWTAIQRYPPAIFWSVLLSSTLIMEGYDLALLGSLFASPAFNKKYGTYDARSKSYTISASWQSGLYNGARAGEIIGLILAGWLVDRFGYRLTTIGFLLLIVASLFFLFFAPNAKVLVLGEVLCGLPWGAFLSITPAYASEVAPVVLRPYLTTWINMCWIFGQFFAAAVNRASVDRGDMWAYRIPFAVQWVWPIPIFVGLLFAPESPWWHIRKGNRMAARMALGRLTWRAQSGTDLDKTIAMIEYTNAVECNIKDSVSYLDCLRGVDLRRTEIVVGVCLVQTLSGQNLIGYSAYFLVQAGLDPKNSFSLALGQYALGLVGTAGSWFLMSKLGRRQIFFAGLCCQSALLIVVGSLSFSATNGAVWAVGTILIIFTFAYQMTVGPVTYSLISELPSTRLKTKTIVLSCVGYNASSIFVNVMTNYQLSSTNWNWGTKTAYFWAGTCLLCTFWVYFRLPEPKGRTYAELDLLFDQGVSARKFATTHVNAYRDNVMPPKMA